MAGEVSVTFANVGQGDCTIGVDGDTGDAIVIDCPMGRHEVARKALLDEGAKRIRVAIATHSDLDHIGGILPVVTSMPTDCVRVNGSPVVCADPNERVKLRSVLTSLAGLPHHGIAVHNALNDASGAAGAIKWVILAPDQAQLLRAGGKGSPNHASVITRLDVYATSFLIGADADGESWHSAITAGKVGTTTVLAVPHHGAKMAPFKTTDFAELMNKAKPAYCVISVGATNHYGHPAKETLLELVTRMGLLVYSTQWNAAWSDGLPKEFPDAVGAIRFLVESGGMFVSAH
jgi:beta-lactamase superfamily II metal-dependent hydrolase